MKKTTFTILLSLLTLLAFSQQENPQAKIDSIEKSFHYEHGTINLKNGVAKIIVPKGFKYLNQAQAERVLVEIWGNPKSENISLGLLLPENQGILDQKGYVFNIQYDEIGFVKDDDADDIDYDDLLAEMKKETIEENKERKKEGYETIDIVAWAAKPFYDEDRKILHWAKEIKFGNNPMNTLNYNVRVLGRKGVLVLNAIATKADLPLVQKDINKVLDIVQFNEGYQYKDFDSSIDEVAAWTIGGLVAGKVLAKVGLFAVFAKFGKIIVLAVLGFFGTFKNKIKNLFSKNKNTESDTEALPEHTDETTEATPIEAIEETQTEETAEKENKEES